MTIAKPDGRASLIARHGRMAFFWQCLNLGIRLLSKLASERRFEGDTERRTAAYFWVREDSSTGSTYKSSAEVEFRKKSIII